MNLDRVHIMIVENATVALGATHRSTRIDEIHESLRVWIGDTRPDFEARERGAAGRALAPSAVVSISQAARAAAQLASVAVEPADSQAQAIDEALDAVERDPKLLLIRSLVEMMTGRTIATVSASDWRVQETLPVHGTNAVTTPAAPVRAGFGVEYDRHEVHEESERTTFHAQVRVRTDDGREIAFTLDLVMARSYREQIDVSLRAGDGIRKDPLVINFHGSAAELQEQRFTFDLDGDGEAERLPTLSGGSGYLALDRNGNGQIDSGVELFGTASGNGFADLAALDSDGNGWIDAGDPVFGQLRAWSIDAQGGTSLHALSELGVGALSLTHVDTPFALKDSVNRTLGGVRATGIYLNDNGSAGTLQQIDLIA